MTVGDGSFIKINGQNVITLSSLLNKIEVSSEMAKIQSSKIYFDFNGWSVVPSPGIVISNEGQGLLSKLLIQTGIKTFSPKETFVPDGGIELSETGALHIYKTLLKTPIYDITIDNKGSIDVKNSSGAEFSLDFLGGITLKNGLGSLTILPTGIINLQGLLVNSMGAPVATVPQLTAAIATVNAAILAFRAEVETFKKTHAHMYTVNGIPAPTTPAIGF
jgi:hypothetical protein